ncbi:MAG: hypothetical protein HW380_1457 [Magnetococcales bacterium]|nr:hypothetical protein [Magnetococcales bacterium]
MFASPPSEKVDLSSGNFLTLAWETWLLAQTLNHRVTKCFCMHKNS